MSYGVIENGLVIDAKESDPIFAAEQGWVELPDTVGIGYRFDNGVFLPPVPTTPALSVPQSISDRQFFQYLARTGVITVDEGLAAVTVGELPASMRAIIDRIPDEAVQTDVKFNLCGATTFERQHPYTLMLAAMYGWNTAKLDDIFIGAGAL